MASWLCHLSLNQHSLRNALPDPYAPRQHRMARNSLGRRHTLRTSPAASLSSFRQWPRMGPGRTPLRAAARILEARSESGLTMAAPQRSLTFRLAHSSLQLALRLWPEESRHWAQALTAELDEIQQPFEAPCQGVRNWSSGACGESAPAIGFFRTPPHGTE